MDKKRITIGERSYIVEIADTEDTRKEGLMKREFLAPDEGMLFVWPKEGTREMWMKDTKIALDQIGINSDDEVVKVYTAQPNDETLIPFENCKYVLEINANSGIIEGDELDIDDENLDKYTMKIIGSDGGTQGFLQGGERIFSRISTRHIIKWAKKAEEAKDDQDLYPRYCRRLGKIVFKELKAQDSREPQYVSTPN